MNVLFLIFLFNKIAEKTVDYLVRIRIPYKIK